MDTALLAYSGISVKMLVDRAFGADLLTMFTVDYEPGGAAQAHDHPFEETYFFLAGEVEAELDGGLPAPRRRRGASPASAASTASTTTARSGSAGSRPRRPSRRRGTPIAGSPTWKRVRGGTERCRATARVLVVGGTRGDRPGAALGRLCRRRAARRPDRAGPASRSRRRSRPSSGAVRGVIALRPRRAEDDPRPRWRGRAGEATSCSSRSTATRTRSATTTSTARSGS